MNEKDSASGSQVRIVFLPGIALTVLLYVIPGGQIIGRPLVLFATLVHELGHGLAALAVGGRFEALQMWRDGSGMATLAVPDGALRQAVVAAGGLVGPAVAAALCFFSGRTPRRARGCLAVTGIGLVVAEVLVVRNLFGFAFVALVALVLLLVAAWGRHGIAQLVVVFLGVQLALSVFARRDYLFMQEATTATGVMPSDTALIAGALWLPYWFWGGLIGLLSVAILFVALVASLRQAGNSRRSERS